MHKTLTLLLVIFSFSAHADTAATSPSWHKLGKISKVAVLGDRFHVRGTTPSGYACPDRSSFYGTVSLVKSEQGYSEYYSMALAGYMAGKSMACYIAIIDDSSFCKMTNCYLY